MVFLVQAVMLSGSIMFVYCYYGEMATGSFENISDALYESDWQNLSLQLQKYYILMIGNAQRPLYYHGFHVSILSLNTFAKVMHGFWIILDRKCTFKIVVNTWALNNKNSVFASIVSCAILNNIIHFVFMFFLADQSSVQLLYGIQNNHRNRIIRANKQIKH